jgi:hypothetical protein
MNEKYATKKLSDYKDEIMEQIKNENNVVLNKQELLDSYAENHPMNAH